MYNKEVEQQQTNKLINKTVNTVLNNDEPIKREQWARKTEFLLAIIGFSVDLGNIWRCKIFSIITENKNY